jgi:glucose/arabinose dehydrogenase
VSKRVQKILAAIVILLINSFTQKSAQEQKPLKPKSSTNNPQTITFRPSMLSLLKVPAGWTVNIAATGLGHPRMLYADASGHVYATRRDKGDVIMLTDKNNDGKFDQQSIVAGFKGVHGITIKDEWMYLCNNNELRRYRVNINGTLQKEYETLITGLPDAGRHPNRTIDFGPDGMLYMSIGSTCNDCSEHAEMATIVQIDPKTWKRSVFVSGLRNTIGFDWHPQTHELWGCDNGGDGKGDDWPPEEVNHLVKGRHYGFPYAYAKKIPDETHADPPGESKENFAKKTEASVLELKAHMAPIAFRFFPSSAKIPANYVGDGLVCFHGSWNRSVPAGYKVMRIKFENGIATGADDFLSGFLIADNKQRFGRPAGITITAEGVVYISDDANGVIYCVKRK